MTARRVLKVAEAIRETVSLAILTELRDPRVQDVTVTFVEVSADLRHAKVHISVMGDERKESLVLHGLDAAAGFLQRQVGDRLDTRYIPRLKFVIDKGVKHSMAVARILDEVLPADESAQATDGSSVRSAATGVELLDSRSPSPRPMAAKDDDDDEDEDEDEDEEDDFEKELEDDELEDDEFDEDFDDEDEDEEDDEEESDDDASPEDRAT